jgi:hypothetical protein
LEGDIEEVRYEVKQRMEREEEERKYRKKN